MKMRLVVLTGAGISAESGLKTFRDGDGFWENHRVEDVATPEAFIANPALVLEFYNQRRKAAAAAKPNIAHILLADLEKYFDVNIITQNVDDMHERAGSTKVLHLHGKLNQARSVKNNQLVYNIGNEPIEIGDLAKDGGQLRPHIVWFGESVPMIEPAMDLCGMADIFIVIGTSLQVYPAAGLVQYVPIEAIKYMIDKNMPEVSFSSKNVEFMEGLASKMMPILSKKLIELIQ
jgi:NAD-dependent deacetylase